MSAGDALEPDMTRFALDSDSVERIVRGAVEPADAPPGYGEVARLLQDAAAGARISDPGTARAATVAAVAEAVRSHRALELTSPRKSMITKAKLAAAGLVGALTLTSGLAAANALPGAAQQAASDALAKVGVSVPAPNDHAGTHPDTRGKSADHPAGTPQTDASNGSQPSDNKGSEISNLAHTTDATGVDKGAAISNDASNGKSQAGQHGPPTANPAPNNASPPTPASGNAPVATPNGGGTSTANTASNGHSSTGTANADQHSNGAASAGSGNADAHRP